MTRPGIPTTRGMFVSPDDPPPARQEPRQSLLIGAAVLMLMAVVAYVVWPASDDGSASGGAGTDRIALGGELRAGESITAGDYSFTVTPENLQITRRGADGTATPCWSSGSGQGLSAVRVTLQGLVMSGDRDQIYGTIAPQSMGASDPNAFALRIDPADGTVRVGDVVLGECAQA